MVDILQEGFPALPSPDEHRYQLDTQEGIREYLRDLIRALESQFNFQKTDADNLSAELTSPTFSVHKNGTNQTAIVSGVDTLITWSTEEFDTLSYFSGDRFTPLVAGRYFLTGQIRYTTSTDQGAYQIKVYKNGAEYKTSLVRGSGTGSLVADIQVIVNANGTTDYFEIYARHDSGADKTVDGTSDRSWFCGTRVT